MILLKNQKLDLFYKESDTLAQATFRLVLTEQVVSPVIVGFKTPIQVRENFSAAGQLI